MTFLLALALLAAPARAADKIVFRADPRLEAVGSVELALKNRARGFTDPKDDYSRKVLERLKPFADHPALKLQAAFPKAFTFADRCDIADRLTLDLRSTTSYFLPDPTTNLAGGPAKVEEWLGALSDLSAKADLPGLFASEKAGLDARAEPFLASARDLGVVESIEEYAGRRFDGAYTVTVSPFMDQERMLDSVWRRADGTRELHTVVGASAGRRHSEYYFKERFPTALWHQLAHGLWDEKVEQARAELATRTDGRKDPCFGAWEQCVKENLVRAVTARLIERASGPRAAKRFLHNGDQDLYPVMPELLDRLREYEAHRELYPTLDSYLPKLFEAFPKKDAQAR